MNFVETRVNGAYIIEIERLEDKRGFFARTWCRQEQDEQGLDPNLAQCSISFNRQRGTLRGMHLQLPPHAETKIVRCTQGAIFDVLIDLRTRSSTYMKWYGLELTAENRRALYVPKGCAHGFLTLANNTEVLYQISDFYAPEFARGLRWNDPRFSILWPEEVTVISERDQSYEDYDPAVLGRIE